MGWNHQRTGKCPFCGRRRVLHDCSPDSAKPYRAHCQRCCAAAAALRHRWAMRANFGLGYRYCELCGSTFRPEIDGAPCLGPPSVGLRRV